MRIPQVLKGICYSGRTKIKFKRGSTTLHVKDVPSNVCLCCFGDICFISFVLCCPGCLHVVTRSMGETLSYSFGFIVNPLFWMEW